jgi:hypothetical protein
MMVEGAYGQASAAALEYPEPPRDPYQHQPGEDVK